MNKVLAMLAAACMVLAMVGPSVMADPAASTATVNDVAPTITSITITPDDDGASGVQISPVINGDKTVTVTVVVADGNGLDDIESVSLVSVLDGQTTSVAPLSGAKADSLLDTITDGTYIGTFTMAYYDNPDDYTVLVTVTDGTTSVDDSAVFTYLGSGGINVVTSGGIVGSMNQLPFGAVSPGGSSAGTPTATVTNTGNTVYTTIVTPTDLTGPGSELIGSDKVTEIGNSVISTTVLLNGLTSSVTGTFQLVSIESALLPGSYSGTIAFAIV